MRGYWRRSRGQNVPPHLLRHESLPQRLHPHRVRKLYRRCKGQRGISGRLDPLGHRRTRGLRPTEAAFVSPMRRLPRLLLGQQSGLAAERQEKVDPGAGSPPSPRRSRRFGRQ